MFEICFVLQEHIKNEKITTIAKAVATTSIPEMSSTDAM
jgi:hypothetical protein